jgi:hypothetical protein
MNQHSWILVLQKNLHGQCMDTVLEIIPKYVDEAGEQWQQPGRCNPNPSGHG